jgi:hypothetical protein
MSESNQTAKEADNCLGPLVSGEILGVMLPCGQPQVDEGMYFKSSNPRLVLTRVLSHSQKGKDPASGDIAAFGSSDNSYGTGS